MFEVTALRFHQQQRGLVTKEEYRILNGRMVSFWYQPPSSTKLQVYDRYPLVIIIKRRSNGFTGINFHYLGIRERAELLTYMRDRLAWEHDPKKTRLQITYKMLLSKKRYKYFRPALKSYYKTNIKSRFRMIPEKNWDKALLLPIESFEGNVPTERIWRDSKRMAIRESNRHNNVWAETVTDPGSITLQLTVSVIETSISVADNVRILSLASIRILDNTGIAFFFSTML